MSRRPLDKKSINNPHIINVQQNKNFGLLAFGVLGLIAIAGFVIQNLVPTLLLAGTGYGIYYLATRKSALHRKNIAQRLHDLKDSIGQCDRQLKLLDSYLSAKDYTQYGILARQILPQLKEIQTEATALKEEIDIDIYKRIMKHAHDEEENLTTHLSALNISATADPASDDEKYILEKAPEIAEAYRNIQRDHIEILAKLEKADNRAELEAIHNVNMNRFRDILDGYLKIKETPKDYYDADERLEQAKAAIHQFDLDLDETLRKLNESQLSDFDISLRMMGKHDLD